MRHLLPGRLLWAGCWRRQRRRLSRGGLLRLQSEQEMRHLLPARPLRLQSERERILASPLQLQCTRMAKTRAPARRSALHTAHELTVCNAALPCPGRSGPTILASGERRRRWLVVVAAAAQPASAAATIEALYEARLWIPIHDA